MKRKFAVYCVALALAAMMMLPGMASADIKLSASALGTYWSQPGSITFDKFDTYFTDSAQFSSVLNVSGVNGDAATVGYGGSFVSDGWIGSYVSPTVSTASGPGVTTLAWDYNFLGSALTAPVRFDINYFNKVGGVETFVGHEGYVINGQGAYVGGFDMTQYSAVPIPPAVLLMGTGLLGLAFMRRKKARA